MHWCRSGNNTTPNTVAQHQTTALAGRTVTGQLPDFTFSVQRCHRRPFIVRWSCIKPSSSSSHRRRSSIHTQQADDYRAETAAVNVQIPQRSRRASPWRRHSAEGRLIRDVDAEEWGRHTCKRSRRQNKTMSTISSRQSLLYKQLTKLRTQRFPTVFSPTETTGDTTATYFVQSNSWYISLPVMLRPNITVVNVTFLSNNSLQERPAVADKPAPCLRKVCTVYVRAVGL